MEKKKIGIDARVLQQPITGVGNNIIQIIKEIRKIDKTIDFILFFSKEPLCSAIEEIGDLSKVVIPVQKSFIWEQLKLPMAIKKHQIDIYHAPWNAGLPFRKICKCVVTIHDLIPLEIGNYFESWRSKLIYKIRMSLSGKRSDKIITDSNYSKEKIVEYLNVSEDKIIVAGNAVSNIFHPIKDLKILDKIKEKYDLETKFLLYVGGFDPRKNVDILIKSFNYYLQQTRRSDLKLVMVGAKNDYYLKL